MLRAYELQEGRLKPATAAEDGVVWWDLLHPSRDEELALESRLGLGLPTIEDMQEIEVSSRLYSEDGGHFMTALVPSHTDGDDVVNGPITFILADHRLITIRYTEPRAFTLFPQRAEKAALGLSNGETTLLGLLEAVVDRLADVLERAGRELDAISRRVFDQNGAKSHQDAGFRATLVEIGRKGDLTSNIRESLVTLERVLTYLVPRLNGGDATVRDQLQALIADVGSLTDHADFLTQKITFLLDATLGLINIEQNGIIKIFSVAAVVFLPPTLVASLYGMNFEVMPELHWTYGYPLAIVLMILSAVVTYLFFKRRGWL